MLVPFFPLLGLPNQPMLFDPALVFTPLTVGLVVLSSFCGLGLGVLLARVDAMHRRGTAAPHSAPPPLSKAA
jgi:hypothetical protein